MRLAATMVLLATAGCAEHSRAREDYLLQCVGCHGEDGAGLVGHVPDMRRDLARLAASTNGRAYLLRVPGVTQSTLEPDQLAEVLNYTLREFGGPQARTIARFTAAEVAASRTSPLLEVTVARAGVLSGQGLP